MEGGSDDTRHTRNHILSQLHSNPDPPPPPSPPPAQSPPTLTYASEEYWLDRHSTPNPHEWLANYAVLQPYIRAFLVPLLLPSQSTEPSRPSQSTQTLHVLHPGYGTSTLDTSLETDTTLPSTILTTNTDISPALITSSKHSHPGGCYLLQSCLVSPPLPHLHNCCIDKGTFDTFCCHPTESLKRQHTSDYLEYLGHSLPPGSPVLVMSFGAPEVRMRFFRQEVSRARGRKGDEGN